MNLRRIKSLVSKVGDFMETENVESLDLLQMLEIFRPTYFNSVETIRKMQFSFTIRDDTAKLHFDLPKRNIHPRLLIQ